MKFKVGDTVMIISKYSPNKGKISKITKVYDSYKNCPAVYDLDGFDISYSEKSLLKVEYEVGDRVRCIKKDSVDLNEIFIVMELERYPMIGLSGGRTFFVDEIEKVESKFKIGNKVRVNNPGSANNGKVGTIIKIYPNCIYEINGIATRIDERFLELYKDPEFKRGDFVAYKNGKAVYKVTEIIKGSIGIKHLQTGNCYTDKPERLFKLKFQEGQEVRIKSIDVVGTVLNAAFNSDEKISYKVAYNNGIALEPVTIWSIEDNLEKIESAILTTIEASPSNTVEVTNRIAEASKILTKCVNELKNEDNENQLQRKETSERERNDARGSRIYGRKPKSTVKIKCLSYEKVYCRS